MFNVLTKLLLAAVMNFVLALPSVKITRRTFWPISYTAELLLSVGNKRSTKLYNMVLHIYPTALIL